MACGFWNKITEDELVSLNKAGFMVKTGFGESSGSKSDSCNRRKKWRHGISKAAQKRIDIAETMDATLLQETIIFPKQHVMFRVLTKSCYNVHIKAKPYCSCPDF